MRSDLRRILPVTTVVWRQVADHYTSGWPPSTTWRVKLNNTENCRQPSSCLECPSAPNSLLHLTASFWSPPGQSLEISSSKIQSDSPCKFPGLLSSGLLEHFASSTAVACMHTGLHRGHDLLGGKVAAHVQYAPSLAPVANIFMLTWGTNKALYKDSIEIISDTFSDFSYGIPRYT